MKGQSNTGHGVDKLLTTPYLSSKHPNQMEAPKKQGHKDYDRIMRENISPLLPAIVGKLLGLKVDFTRRLSKELPKTLDLSPDAVFEVSPRESEKFILHIEFQTRDDPTMASRMALYKMLLGGLYGLEIRQCVIFLGSRPSKMKVELPESVKYTGFDILNLCKVDYSKFKDSDTHEEIVLSILSDFNSENSESVVRNIFQRLLALESTQSQVEKSIQQLLVLSQLRNLDDLVTQYSKHMPIIIDIRENAMFKEGQMEGRMEGSRRTLLKMWQTGRFTMEALADLMEMSQEELYQQLELASEEERLRQGTQDNAEP
jgi:hypothetical protein